MLVSLVVTSRPFAAIQNPQSKYIQILNFELWTWGDFSTAIGFCIKKIQATLTLSGRFCCPPCLACDAEGGLGGRQLTLLAPTNNAIKRAAEAEMSQWLHNLQQVSAWLRTLATFGWRYVGRITSGEWEPESGDFDFDAGLYRNAALQAKRTTLDLFCKMPEARQHWVCIDIGKFGCEALHHLKIFAFGI